MALPLQYKNRKKLKNGFKKYSSLFLFLASFFSLLFFASSGTWAATGILKQINFQGKVVNTDGTNVANGSYAFVFSLYTVSSGGTNVWTESKSVTVTDGIFQTNLGDTTTLPGSVDFNTDNIYLGINFNSDGEMSPRVRFTAAPYALNALKVGGLTVTDTTGTLTIPNSKTISFGDTFTTTGAFPLTLTSTASTTATLPSGTITLADLATGQTLTNKIIGSTGLTFTGATMDITTGTNEDLTIVANGSGIINLNDAVSASGTITFSGLSTAGIVTNTSGGVLGTVTSIPVANGGTNATTIGSAGSIAYSTGTAYAFSAVGTTGQALISGGTGSPTFFAPTAGSVLFAGTGGILQQDNANYFWDDATNRLGLGTASPGARLDLSTSSTSTTGASEYGFRNIFSDTGVMTSGSDNTYGQSTSVTRTGATGGSVTTYGIKSYVLTDNAGSGNSTAYGIMASADGADYGYGGSFSAHEAGGGGSVTGVESSVYPRSGNGTGVNIGLEQLSTTTANTNIGLNVNLLDGGDISSGTDTTYGANILTQRHGATAGTIDTYGLNLYVGTDNAGAGTATAYGILIDTGVSGSANADTVYGLKIATEANTSTTAYGVYVDVGAEAGTEYAAAFLNGNVGIGDTTPDALLDLDFSQTSGTLFGIAAPSAVTLAGTLTGQSIDLSTNVTATGQSMIGTSITLPAVTNTAGSTYTYRGLNVSAGNLIQTTTSGTDTFSGVRVANPNLTQTAGTLTANGVEVAYGTNTTGGTQNGFKLTGLGGMVSAGALNGLNLTAITPSGATETAILIGSGWDTILDTASLDITGTGAITGATGVSTTTVTASSAIAANGGITFDNSTDTLGAHTLAGTLDASTQILTNIGNAGTDFIASTGALTLAGVLTANGGISLSASQSLTAVALSYMDLGAITQSSTANQGLRLPNAASATPSNPTSGEGYLAWDGAGNQLITYNGSAWTTVGGGGYNLIKDEAASLTARTTLAFLGAGVSCADNASQTECTIAGGSGADLQGTYDTDANGSNVTISLTAADDGLVFTNPTSGGNDLSAFLLSLTQQNTTAGIVVLDMVQSSNAANGANLTANSIDGETGLAITTNGLTSGKGISVTSSSTAFTGNLADISLTGSDASNTGNVLAVSNTGTANANTTLFVDHRATGTGNLALRIDDESSDTTPFIIDGDGRVGIGTSTISQAASTERLLQVGSETNRGNSVTYGEVVTKGLKDSTALTGIKDVFVYDTTADSDGGRWIDWATTDKLSWYTETLDDGPSDPCVIASDDRCYKSAFPRKAILIVTTSALYIFDAQDNKMWMKFSQNAAGYALGVDTNNDPSSVTALNGVIYVGTNGSAPGGLYAIDFVNDRMWNYDDTDRSGADVGIASRNSAVTYGSDNQTALDLGGNTGWKTINDVSAASIQWSNTAIAATTGPVNGTSFVALATDSGVNLINLAQQRLLQYSRITDDNYESVVITKSARLYALDSTRDELNMWNNVDSDVANQLNAAADKAWDETTNPALTKTTPAMIVGAPDALEVIERGSMADSGLTAGTASDLIYIGTDQGLTELHDHATLASGWVKYYNTTRQTAILPAATRRAHMMDDASGDVTNQSVGTDVMLAKGTPTYGVSGVRGKAMSFDGATQYLCSGAGVTCANDTSDNLSTGSWTISAWFKHATNIAGTDVLFARCYNTTPAAAAGCVAISMPSTGVMTVNVDYDATFTIGVTGTTVFHTSTQTYNDNQWHFIMVTRAATTGNINTMIDGKPIGQTAGLNTTLDVAQIIGIGTDCSVGAACATGGNFWEGAIDDFVYNANGSTGTTNNLTVAAMRRVYNDARPTLGKKTITVTDATTATSTTLAESGSGWIPNEFAGLIMEVTGSSDSDCVGVTRRVVSNTTDTLTFSPAAPGACTLDTSADFEVDPESINGASNSVYAIGITAESPLGEARQMCIGTDSGTDTGGVTCYNHQAGPNIVAEMFHSQSGQEDDSATSWTGTDYDDIRSIDLSGRALVIGSEAHFWTETQDVRLGQGLDYLANQLFSIRQEIVNDAITAQGSIGAEVGFTGGADLAERYYSNETLQAGEVVAIDPSLEAGVKKTTGRYQRDTLGIVATTPGIILGTEAENSYPIALVGRVPVKVTNENGQIYAGDRITSASRVGYSMRATQAGRVIGQVLGDAVDWTVCEGEDPASYDAVLCTTVMVFVNLSDYYGQPVELAMAGRNTVPEAAGLTSTTGIDGAEQGLASSTDTSVRLTSSAPTKQEQILTFLKEIRDKEATRASSEVFTGRVAASKEIITPTLFADKIFAKSIKADSIEGLQIWTDSIASLQEKYAGLNSAAPADTSDATAQTVAKQLTVAMKNLSADTLTVELDGSILGKLSVAGALRIGGDATFSGNTIFERLVSFFGDILFKGGVAFEKTPTFSADTAGFAVIEKGAKEVHVAFGEPYENQPIVAVTLTNDQSPLLDNKTDAALAADIAAVEKDYLKQVFDADTRYIVTEKSSTGFTIVLSKKAPQDLKFSWVALAVEKASTSVSQKSQEENPPAETGDTLLPVETPTLPLVLPEQVASPIATEKSLLEETPKGSITESSVTP